MEKMKLGAQLYTLREYCSTSKMFKKTMKKVAEMGYKYIQFSGLPNDVTNDMMKEWAEANGLIVGLTHTDDDLILNNTEKVIKEHDDLGCRGIGIGGMPREFRNYDGYMKFIEKYGPAIEKLKQAGKVFCYHNHWFEFERYENGKTGMEILLENTDPDGFKLTLDTAWAHRAGIDCAEFIRKYKDRIFATHLKDLTIINDELTVTEMLTGNMNFDSILEECQKAGIEWQFVEQDWIRINAYDSMKISYDNLMARYPQYFE